MAIHFADEMNLKYNDLEKNKILKISMPKALLLPLGNQGRVDATDLNRGVSSNIFLQVCSLFKGISQS